MTEAALVESGVQRESPISSFWIFIHPKAWVYAEKIQNCAQHL